MTSPLQIAEVMAIGISLTLKTYIPIGLVPVTIAHEPQQPLKDIDDIKRQEEHLAHLSRMDTLVVDHIAVDPRRIPRPEGAEKVYTYSLGYKPALDYKSFFSFTTHKDT